MKKLYFLLAFLCCAVTQLKADVIQPSTTPYYPEHVYTMVNANGWYADANTHGTQDQAASGHFAFYPVSGIDNAYYIYSVDNNKWLTYTKASSYSNKRDFISMSSSFGIDDYFYLNQRQTGYYDIAPYKTSDIANIYLNWFEGANESHTTIGLWQQNLNDDPGSKFSFSEVTIDSEEIPYFTVTSKGRGTWVVSNSMTSWESQHSATLDASNELQHFAFIKKNDNVYLYNKGISKYINKDYSFTDDPKDGITFLYGNAIDGDKENNLSTDNSFVICFDNSNFINLGGESQIVIDGWGPNSASNGDGKTDIGNCLTITKQGTFTIKQPEPEPEPEPEGPETDMNAIIKDLSTLDCTAYYVNGLNGTLQNESYDYYNTFLSNNTFEHKTAKKNGDIYEIETTDINFITINCLYGDIENASQKVSRMQFDATSDSKDLKLYISSNNITTLELVAGTGYSIIGYYFDYNTNNTTNKQITITPKDKEAIVSQGQFGSLIVKGLEASSTRISIQSTDGNTSIEPTLSNFVVVLRKGEPFTSQDLNRDLDMNYIFTIIPKDSTRGALYAPAEKNSLDACGAVGYNDAKYTNVTISSDDEAQQFIFVPYGVGQGWYYKNTYPDHFFLYSVSEDKFVSRNNDKTILTDYPAEPVIVVPGTGEFEGYYQIKFDGPQVLGISPENCNGTIESCAVALQTEPNEGNNFALRIVRKIDTSHIETGGDIYQNIIRIDGQKDDLTFFNNLQAKAEETISAKGIGYPINNERIEAISYMTNQLKDKSMFYVFDLNKMLNEHRTDTNVQMPQNGKAYRIKTHYNGTLGRYLKAAEGGVLSIVNEGQHETDNSTVFVARSIDEAANGEGTFAFVGENGQFLVGARTGTQGFVPTYNDDGNTGDLRVSTAANKGDYFGGFILKTTEGTNTYNLQLGAAGTGTNLGLIYDAENPNAIFRDPNGGSSIFFLEEVAEYPNEVSLRFAKNSDGNSYSSIWLPFSVDIPEGVRVYKAHVDKANNQLVCGEVKNHLPAGNGAIIIGSEETKITLVPSIADMAPLQDNDLKGTNVTLARNQNVTTFVLNGGKGEIGFYPYTGTNIAKYKAYVEVDKAQAAQGLRFSFGTATDIENTLTEGEGEAKEYYDLSGRRVAQPTKGLYIVNGKKMYIK